MSLVCIKKLLTALALLLLALGCRTPPTLRGHVQSSLSTTASTTANVTRPPGPAKEPSEIQTVAFQEPATSREEEIPRPPFDEADELSLDRLIDDVLATHPSVEAMVAAWQAAADRYPQVVS